MSVTCKLKEPVIESRLYLFNAFIINLGRQKNNFKIKHTVLLILSFRILTISSLSAIKRFFPSSLVLLLFVVIRHSPLLQLQHLCCLAIFSKGNKPV